MLQVSNPLFAGEVTDYLLRNRADFDNYDRHYGDSVYTVPYTEKALRAERDLYNRKEGVRYYIFLKGDHSKIIGNVSFSYLADKNRQPALGYKIDKDYRRNGYAYEACAMLLPLAVKDYGIDSIYADVLPDNTASEGLLKKLGFRFLMIAFSSHEVKGIMRDHKRYVFDPNLFG